MDPRYHPSLSPHLTEQETEAQVTQCLRTEPLALGPGEGHGTPLQYSCLENPMDRGAWVGCSPWVTKSRTRLKRVTQSQLLS